MNPLRWLAWPLVCARVLFELLQERWKTKRDAEIARLLDRTSGKRDDSRNSSPETVEPAYTPRAEYRCNNSTTHYQGCECHEARWKAHLAGAEATAAIHAVQNLKLQNAIAAQPALLREALEALGITLNEWSSFMMTMTDVNVHGGYQFTQLLMLAKENWKNCRETYERIRAALGEKERTP